MERLIIQVYFSPEKDTEIYDKAKKLAEKKKFSNHVKELMKKESFIEEIRSMLQVPATTNNKPGKQVLSQFI